MSIRELFSFRKKRERGELPDVYVYDQIPKQLRVQIIHIWREQFGEDAVRSRFETNDYKSVDPFDVIVSILRKEYGVFQLAKEPIPFAELGTHLQACDYEQVLDAVEVSFDVLDWFQSNYLKRPKHVLISAIEELNQRFRYQGVGYELHWNEDARQRQFIRIDSQFVHATVIKPVLDLLQDKCYAGTNQEFLKAHDEYRKGVYKDCLVDCLKAFESTLKVICDKRGWLRTPNATAKELINVCLQNDLVPQYMQTHLSGLRSTLESGLPTVRNKLGGHGQGSQVQDVERYVAQYALNLTATNILFLIESDKALGK